QLSSLYSLIDDYSKALSSLDISRIAKLDLKESEYLRLIGWLRHGNVPYKAAEILYKKIQSKEIQSSEKNLNYLGDLYYEAKAYDKAIKSYTQAAKIDNNGKIYYKIAQISMSQYKYQAVIENIKLSLKFENKEKLGDKYLLLGKTYYELKKSSQAKKAFENARKYKKSEKMANAWLKYIRF
ncbi:MAG: tetratricopeptide repeat protein, partial [Campylobacterota bacterium]|nr:tetratricopeptide repeat protein [Campylobacterota bacterium]